jgi:prepilin-type N-terminal cleavage/methylation domain-containing protein
MINARRELGFTLIETLMVVALIGVVSVIAVPMFGNMLGNFRVTGDARGLSNSVAVAKMRAAATFSRVRLYATLADGQFYTQTWVKEDLAVDPEGGDWVTEGGTTYLSAGVSFGFGVVGAPPPSTQGVIGQAPPCTTDDGADIAGTACIMFNSRGVPIDNTFAPTAQDALYITDGTAVFGVTAAATGMLKSWRTLPTVTPNWVLH